MLGMSAARVLENLAGRIDVEPPILLVGIDVGVLQRALASTSSWVEPDGDLGSIGPVGICKFRRQDTSI